VRDLFDKTLERNIVTWNAILGTYSMVMKKKVPNCTVQC
jgi:hypothetical protein